jgi:hypothetical protein
MYEDIGLKALSSEAIQDIERTFEKFHYRRIYIDDKGSHVLGLNLLFSDPFMTSIIALKFDVKGNFDASKVYTFNDFSLLHSKFQNKGLAILFKGVGQDVIHSIEKDLALKTHATTSFSNPFISSAHADDCDLGPRVNLDTAVAEQGQAKLLGECFTSFGEGAYAAAVGDSIQELKSVSTEFKGLLNSPAQKLTEYYNHVTKGVQALWDFSKTVGKMMIDPNYGTQVLVEKYGEFGNFIASTLEKVRNLPAKAKMDILCNTLGSFGVDGLTALLTAGSMSGRILVKLAKVTQRIDKILDLIHKGVKIGAKYIYGLSQKAHDQLSTLIEQGKLKQLEKNLAGVGCAF